jgi:hypothetical protein
LTDAIPRFPDAIPHSPDVIPDLTDAIPHLTDVIPLSTDGIPRSPDVIPQLLECSALWLCACAGSMGAMAKVESDEMGLKLTCVEKWLNSAAGGICSAIESIYKMTAR